MTEDKDTPDNHGAEKGMREAEVPWFRTHDELMAYITGLVEREHDYWTSCYAMSMAAIAAFNYVAGVLGTTGFQTSFADLDIIRRTRRLDGPFMLIDGSNLLYPQYDVLGSVAEWMESDEMWKWLGERARKLLAHDNTYAVGSVLAHWQQIVAKAEGREQAVPS